ncbi:MAG: hypothetical protein QGI18_03050 [Candidatus Marinimicrobia bacterium]|nr:hypothetical protein [Candidatus Neomarinimicrobiota bacterium]
MILARLIPKGSRKYQIIKNDISVYAELLEKYNIINLFAVWTVTVSGFTYMLGHDDRYSYWDWSGYVDGIIRLVLATTVFYITSKKGIWKRSDNRLGYFDLLNNFIIVSVCFLIGAVNMMFAEVNVIGVVPYFSSIAAGILIYEFKITYDQENNDWKINNWDNKVKYLFISLLLMVLSTVMGYNLDDPIISTVSMVSLFFPAVALIWPSHVRHIKRLQFYPLFILAMFSCVRAPWFLIILGFLFFTIRSINYLKYGIIYPSFGVAQDEILADV